MGKPFWSGVFPAITAQLKSDQSLDLDATAQHAEVLIKSGVTGIVFLGGARRSRRFNCPIPTAVKAG